MPFRPQVAGIVAHVPRWNVRRILPFFALIAAGCAGSSGALDITDAPVRIINARQVPIDIWVDGYKEGDNRAPGIAVNVMLTPGTHSFEIRSQDGSTVLATTTWTAVSRTPRNLVVLNTGFLKDVPGSQPVDPQIGLRVINATPDATATIDVRNTTTLVQSFAGLAAGAVPSEAFAAEAQLKGQLYLNGSGTLTFETELQLVNRRETRLYVAYKRADGTYGLAGFIDIPL